MKKFLIRTCCFSFIWLIIAIVPIGVLLTSKETIRIEEATRRQLSDSSVLVGYAYSYPDPKLKLLHTQAKRPDILVLGTSRTMQFRQGFFNGNFYNAGGAVSKSNEFLPFLKQLQVPPGLLIIGLDQYFFNANWNNAQSPLPEYRQPTFSSVWLQNIGKIWQGILQRKIPVPLHVSPGTIGLSAGVRADGYRADGSYRYNSTLRFPTLAPDYEFRDTRRRIEQGVSRFEYGAELDEKSITEIVHLIHWCRASGVHLIAYLPPYAPSVWKQMTSPVYAPRYGYMHKIYPTLAPLFQANNLSLFDFSNGESLGSSDSEFIDGFHGSEKTYIRMLLRMQSIDSTLRACTKDPNSLKSLLETATGLD